MISVGNIRTILIGICLLLIVIFSLKEKQSKKLNWSLFYSFIWILFLLPITNYLYVEYDFWVFINNKSVIKIPYDILFLWMFFWMLPFYLFKGKYIIIISLFLFWLDIVTMPYLQQIGILKLNKNWLLGEIFLILFVFVPSYLWAKFYYNKKNLSIRSLFQVVIMSLFLLVVIPFCVKIYQTGIFKFYYFSSVYFQVIFIIAFPAFIAVLDLVEKGKGTPFPYDKTQNLVTSGVYAYIKNPIQWSFTILFIPLAIYHQSYLLFFGSVVSLAYTIGVSNPQENEDMEERFGVNWINYKRSVPSWSFLWKPKQISLGTIYFKKDCNQCEEIKKWFENRNAINLKIDFSENYKGEELLQVTYKNYLGKEYKSVKAIAHALEHINLGYASLGWFMRFPIASFFLQSIVDVLGFSEDNGINKCEIKK